MATTKKTATKTVKKTVATKTAKNTAKKTAKPIKKPIKKPATRKPTPQAKTAAAATATIATIALSRDGAWWNITLSTNRHVRIAAGAALAARVRIGGRWTKSLETRIDRLANEQKAYALALELLAKDPRLTKAQLTTRLGGDHSARETVRGLVEHGWL
ncbi:MAG: hypothetical protein NTU45_08855 [Planctomycetota bacterium]|nr:hypothetical protein [Planctomycetota bacterium]